MKYGRSGFSQADEDGITIEILNENVAPKLFIIEYNAKFPPGIEFVMPYDENHVWQNDDYFGASLTSFVKLFERFGYKLVCCNAATGANAFFIREEFGVLFPEVPQNIENIYASPFYSLPENIGHSKSIRTLLENMK